MRLRLFFLLPLVVAQSVLGISDTDYLKADESIPANQLRVSNQHPFVIREPVKFQLPAALAESQNLLAVSHSVSGGTVEAHYLPVQITKTDATSAAASIDIQLRPGESRVYTFQEIGSSGTPASPAVITKTSSENLPLQITTNADTTVDLFDLNLIEIPNLKPETRSALPAELEEAINHPLKIDFNLVEEDHGPVKSTFLYKGENSYEIEVLYEIFSSGSTDIVLQLTPKTIRNDEIYLAIAKIFPSADNETGIYQTGGNTALLEHSGHLSDPLNWFSWGNAEEGESRALLIEPTALPTSSGWTLSRAQEKAVGLGDRWISLSEIASPDAKTVVSDEPIRLHYRLLPLKARSSSDTNEAFAAFAGAQQRFGNEDKFHISFGSTGVRFGFDYSPKTIFGPEWENSLAEIERDFRIANAIGFEWIRIKNRPEITSKELNLLGDLARKNGLKLYLTSSDNLENVDGLLEESGNAIAFVELPADLPEHTIANLRRIHPQLKIATTASSSAFPAIDRPGSSQIFAIAQTFDTETESPTAIANAALLLGGYATKNGKMPVASFEKISLPVHQSDREQANEFYFQLDALLSNGSVALLHVGNLVPTADDSNRFPLLHLNRTPKTQGLAAHSLINRYGAAESANKLLKIELQLAQLRPGKTTSIPVSIRNLTNRELELELISHLPAGLTADSTAPRTMTIGPRERITYEHIIRADDDLAPGFYHIFEEARFDEKIHFGWSYLSNRGRPALDLESPPSTDVEYRDGLDSLATVNFANIRYAIYGTEALENEIVLTNRLQEKLRKATGAPIQRIADKKTTPQEQSRSLLLVGTAESNSKIAELAPSIAEKLQEAAAGDGIIAVVEHPENPNRFLLIVTGGDETGVAKAAKDLLGRL
ncbi:MAG TPA: hypothetical protein VK041_10120 [Opitutales bacterium]|nr:hypothetical protein [Opitutales bacterium]